jgi:hypothetical protein
MPTMQDSVSVGANGVSTNVLAGQLYEFVHTGTKVILSCTGSAIGLRATLIANIPVMNDQAINLQNRFPIIPDDIIYTGVVRACRLVLSSRNTTGAPITFFWRVDVS